MLKNTETYDWVFFVFFFKSHEVWNRTNANVVGFDKYNHTEVLRAMDFKTEWVCWNLALKTLTLNFENRDKRTTSGFVYLRSEILSKTIM